MWGLLPGISGGNLLDRIDRTKVAKSLEDKLSRAIEVGDSLSEDLARRDLEREVTYYHLLVYEGGLYTNTNPSCNYFSCFDAGDHLYTCIHFYIVINKILNCPLRSLIVM